MTTIGFFGTSFCQNLTTEHSTTNGYTTYMQSLVDYYDAQVVNTGVGGGSCFDVRDRQLKPFILQGRLPDISIFVWAKPTMIVDGQAVVMGSRSMLRAQTRIKRLNLPMSDLGPFRDLELLAQSADQLLAHTAALASSTRDCMQTIDQHLLALGTDSRIVHMWSNPPHYVDTRWCAWTNDPYQHYEWRSGTHILPELWHVFLSDQGQLLTQHTHRVGGVEFTAMNDAWVYGANHLDGQAKNHHVFDLARAAISG